MKKGCGTGNRDKMKLEVFEETGRFHCVVESCNCSCIYAAMEREMQKHSEK